MGKMHETPLKVTVEAKRMIRFGAAIFDMTQGEFTEIAVATYLSNHIEELDRAHQEVKEIVGQVVLKKVATVEQ